MDVAAETCSSLPVLVREIARGAGLAVITEEAIQSADLRDLAANTAGILIGYGLAGFGLAGRLSPDPRGYGTHQQLGLPGCTFQMLTQWPCPSCGGTTAFAHFVRGQWPSAINPGL